jgi:hypothetical protein
VLNLVENCLPYSFPDLSLLRLESIEEPHLPLSPFFECHQKLKYLRDWAPSTSVSKKTRSNAC